MAFSPWVNFRPTDGIAWIDTLNSCDLVTASTGSAEELAAAERLFERGHVIGTHNGNFHADEVLACALLLAVPQLSDASILRTRDERLLQRCRIVVDVGNEYDPATLRFDHHQKSFNATLGHGRMIKLSSAGMIYKHFGLRSLRALLQDEPKLSKLEWAELYLHIYDSFIEQLDGMDNGIPSSVGRVNFRVTSHLAARVGSINLKWNDDWSPAREGDRFRHAMKTAAYDFIDVAFEVVRSWLPARQLVLSMMQSHKDNIGFLPVPCPWKRHLNSLEAQHPELAGAVRFVVFQNDPKDTWYVQSVPDESDDGQARKSRMRIRFPPHTRGLSDAALCKAIGLEDCRFVHASGHIGASKTLEGAYAMARVALKENWTS